MWFLLDSGINSLQTTQIIAPALNDNKNGSNDLTNTAAQAPITPAIGSTRPLNCP